LIGREGKGREVVLRVRRTAVFLLLSKVYRLECYGNDVYMKRLPTTAHDVACYVINPGIARV
jgi:hypothetical protein